MAKRMSQKEQRAQHARRIRLTRARRKVRDNLATLNDEALATELRRVVKSALNGLPGTRPMVEQAVVELSAPTVVTAPAESEAA